MRLGRHAGRLARLGALLGICTSTFALPASTHAGPSLLDRILPTSAKPAKPATLAPRHIVAWSIDSVTPQQTKHIMAGRGVVGPDGTLVVGPYGAMSVGGQTAQQAAATIEKNLAAHVKKPRVRIAVEGASKTAPTSAPVSAGVQPRPAPLPPRAPAASPIVPVAAQYLPPPVDLTNVAHLGTPASCDTSAPNMSDWSVVPRPDGGSHGVQNTAFQAPMPSGPPDADMPVMAQEDKSEDLPIQPRRVPVGDGPPLVDGAAPGCGAGGPGGLGGPAPRECAKVSLPPYVIEPPDILIIESTQQIRDQPVRGQHLVRPDGTVALGIYGVAPVAGLTLEQAKEMIARVLEQRIKDFERKNLYVDVLAYNSKFYYVITDGGGFGEQVIRLPITGSETVLDGISQINGLPPVASKKAIWVARSFPCQGGHGSETVLPVDWCGITQRGDTATNYQIMPNDRIYVKAQKLVRIDTALARFLSPIERVLGVTLLGSSTVNSIRNSNNNNNNNNNGF